MHLFAYICIWLGYLFDRLLGLFLRELSQNLIIEKCSKHFELNFQIQELSSFPSLGPAVAHLAARYVTNSKEKFVCRRLYKKLPSRFSSTGETGKRVNLIDYFNIFDDILIVLPIFLNSNSERILKQQKHKNIKAAGQALPLLLSALSGLFSLLPSPPPLPPVSPQSSSSISQRPPFSRHLGFLPAGQG